MTITDVEIGDRRVTFGVDKETGYAYVQNVQKYDHYKAQDRTEVWELGDSGFWIERNPQTEKLFLVRGQNHMNNYLKLRLSKNEFTEIRKIFSDAGFELPKP